MKKTLFLILIFIGAVSCRDTSVEESKEALIEVKSPQSFVKTFEGSIDGKYEIVVKITSNEGLIEGKYFYKSQGGDLKLKGNLDADGNILLNEFNDTGNQVGLFEGKYAEQKISGTWGKPDGSKKMSFELIETTSLYESFQNLVKAENEKKNIIQSGEYECNEYDSYSMLTIKKINNTSCRFSIVVGNENCTGEVDGTITLDANGKAVYKQNNCNLEFYFKSNSIEVNEIDCSDWHGMRCTFHGEYLRK